MIQTNFFFGESYQYTDMPFYGKNFFFVRKAHKNNMAFYATSYFGVILCDINKFYLLTII